jgi:hypothetical protein
MSNFEARQANTPEGIASWPVLLEGEKKTYDDGTSVTEWRCDLIIDDNEANKDAIDNLYAMAHEAASEMFGPDQAKWPKLNQAVRQTSEKANNPHTGKPWEGYEHGKLFISCSSLFKPSVIDITGRTIINPEELYGGMKCIFCVRARAYNNKSKGVKFTLVAVLKTGEGKPFGAERPDASQIFKPLLKPGATPGGAVAAPSGARRQL